MTRFVCLALPLMTLVLATLPACRVQLSPVPSELSTDARDDSNIADAQISGPADAMPCTEGTVNRVSPDTGHCYMFFDRTLERAQAAMACQRRGAQLVSITSLAEHQLVASMIGTSLAMTSGTDAVVEGTFTWDSGEPFSAYTNFRTGEPNSAAGRFEEDCVVLAGPIAGKGWDDRACSAQPPAMPSALFTFVCERP